MQQNQATKEADKALPKLVPATVDGDLTKKRHDACRRAAQRMEDVLFTTGSADCLLLTLTHFKEHPAMREVKAVKEMSTTGVLGNSNIIYYTKTENNDENRH